MVFKGSDYCYRCGALTQHTHDTIEGEPCPRCDERMHHKQLGQAQISECTGCGGLWIDSAAFERICADRERQAAVIATELPPPMPISQADSDRFYLYCPHCKGMMNRTNFAGHSGIVIDICKRHGIWFDRDELRRIIEFIRAGGMDAARQRSVEKLQREQAKLERMRSEPSEIHQPIDFGVTLGRRGRGRDETLDVVHVVGGLLRFLIR